MKKIKLGFSDAENMKKMITVDYPKEDLDGDKIKIAMDTMVSSQVLMGKESAIDRKVKAYEEKVERTDFDIK